MKIKPVLILSILLIFLQAGFAFFLLRETELTGTDPVMANAMVQQAARQWDGLTRGELLSLPGDGEYPQYSVLDRDGTLLVQSQSGLAANIYEAIAHQDMLLDIVVDGEITGKLIINQSFMDRWRETRRGILLLFCVLCGGLLVLMVIYTAYLRRRIVGPFQKLQDFARRVAGGNLDYPLTMDRGNVFGAFTESFDLMREELKAARQREMAADRSKKELVAKLSHDIKTPVASIQAVAELMAVTADNEKTRRQLSVIREKAGQIDGLISDLFHATLEELSQLPVNPLPHDSQELRALVENADYQSKGQLTDIPCCMLAFDRERLQQVFDNIFANAYKYADGPVTVVCRLQRDMMAIKIIDCGPGVDEGELPLILGKYYRGSNAQGKSGAGLGLFISRYLMEQMGGSLSCENTENGFCVTVYLRLA